MISLVAAVSFAAPGPKPFFDKPFLLGAHRGGAQSVPENTVLAFATTARRFPNILLETDVRLTRDGELVLLHDETVDRTTNGKGKISDLTFAEVRKLDAGYRFSPDGKQFPYRGKGLRIPTLAEALAAAPNHRFEIDLKSVSVADRLAEVIGRQRAENRVLLASFLPAAMTRIREKLPDVAVCYDFSNGARLLAALRGEGWEAYQREADVVSMMVEQAAQYKITPDEIARMRAKGIRFQIHTLNTVDEIRKWGGYGVDSILTDSPELLGSELIGRAMARSHAHNDYEHPRPLLDALDEGFTSVEADIFLVDGELRVGHDRVDLKPGRTLEKLYLEPLLERVRINGGSVYPWKGEFTLLVDIKANGKDVFGKLQRRLRRFGEMLSEVMPDGRLTRRAVTIVLSGDRPIAEVAAAKGRYLFIDGRPNDASPDPRLTPMVSDSYSGQFRWNGKGEMPAEEREKLRAWINRIQRNGQRARLWAVPDTPDAWREMHEAGMDLINTDRLAELAAFLRSRR